MRLVYRIVLHMSWALSLLLAGWAVLFYLTMIDEINDEVDDSLENYAEMLVTRSLAGRELPAAYSGSNNGYYLHDVSGSMPKGGSIWFSATRRYLFLRKTKRNRRGCCGRYSATAEDVTRN